MPGGCRPSPSRLAGGRPTPDARASADYTRPIARAQRITRYRRPAFAAGLIGLLVVVTIGAALFGLPLRTWFAQDDELTQLDAELDELTAVNADLAERSPAADGGRRRRGRRATASA